MLRWREWHETVISSPPLTIPRCFKYGLEVPTIVKSSLHSFSDASSDALSVVVYLRLEDSCGNANVSFVAGKTNVAPKLKDDLPVATIPKLELQSAAKSVKLVAQIKKEIDIEINETHYYCDNDAVLKCIPND